MKTQDQQTEKSPAQSRARSPSTVSTASSRSPLVRDASSRSSGKSFSFSVSSATESMGSTRSSQSSSSASSSSGSPPSVRRPAPTSIALAQLEQQQLQQQATGVDAPKSMRPNGNKLAHIMIAGKQQHNLVAALAAQDQRAQIKQQQHAKSRSSGYNFAKLLAHRANRCGQFWSANKMRYLNLACLLMTLLCLLAILLLSKSASSPSWSPLHHDGSHGARRSHASAAAEAWTSSGEPLAAKLDPQPDAAAKQQPPDDEATPTTTDGFQVFDEPNSSAASSSKRDLSAAADARELAADGSDDDDEPIALQQQQPEQQLGALLAELDNFGLLRALQRRLGNATQLSKPVIRRTEDGATVMISATLGAQSNETDESLSKLYGRMLSRDSTGSNNGASSGTLGATITIRSEPRLMFAAGSPTGPMLFAGSPMLSSPFGSPMMMAAPPPPPLGLMAMLMRAAAASRALELDRQLDVAANQTAATVAQNNNNNNKTAGNSTQLATGSDSIKKSNTTSSANLTSEASSEVETFDVSQLGQRPTAASFMPFGPIMVASSRPRALFASGPSGGGGMLVMSSSSFGAGPDSASSERRSAHGLGQPHMLLLGQQRAMFAQDPSVPFAPVSPLLRALLGGLADSLGGEPSDSAHEQQQQSGRAGPQRRDELASPSSASDDWDENMGARDERAPSASNSDDGDREPNEPGAFIERIFSGAATAAGNFDESAGLLAPPGPMFMGTLPMGSIRQTIRRPGVTIERIIDMPRALVGRQQRLGSSSTGESDSSPAELSVQQVGAGVRSQSLSRMDTAAGDNAANEQTGETSEHQRAMGPSALLSRLLMSSGQSDDAPPHSLFMSPAPMGPAFPFSMASPFARATAGSARSARQMMLERASESNDDETDELQPPAAPMWSPSFRAARVRIIAKRPAHSSQSPAAVPQRVQTTSTATGAQTNNSSERREDNSSAANEQLEKRLQQAISAATAAVQQVSLPAGDASQQQPIGAAATEAHTDFTSPGSPLFGFPASAARPEKRPFVYHSNNELAKSHEAGTQARSSSDEAAPPAAVVMGRRLDDGPFAADEQQAFNAPPQLQPVSFRSMQNARQLHRPISLQSVGEQSDMLRAPAATDQKADEFRTIVV